MSGQNLAVIVGLGNPGEEYANTRHNIGFQVVDALAARWRAPTFSKKFKGLYADVTYQGRRVLLLKPQTYMNLSGRSVGELVTFYKIAPETDLMIVSDDLDLPTGKLRIRKNGGSGGHNGLKDIIAALGSEAFARTRVGIGRATGVSGHVLGKIKGSEKETLDAAIERATDAMVCWVEKGIDPMMNQFNKSVEEEVK